jgi:hypothetical protein
MKQYAVLIMLLLGAIFSQHQSQASTGTFVVTPEKSSNVPAASSTRDFMYGLFGVPNEKRANFERKEAQKSKALAESENSKTVQFVSGLTGVTESDLVEGKAQTGKIKILAGGAGLQTLGALLVILKASKTIVTLRSLGAPGAVAVVGGVSGYLIGDGLVALDKNYNDGKILDGISRGMEATINAASSATEATVNAAYSTAKVIGNAHAK